MDTISTVGGSQPGEHHGLGLTEEKAVEWKLTEKEPANLHPRSVVTDVGVPYSPKPDEDKLLEGYKTRVKTVEHPEMREITKTDFTKKISDEPKDIHVPKLTIKMDTIQHKKQVIVVRKVAKKISKTFYRVVEEVRDVIEMVDVVECIDVPWTEDVSHYIVEKEWETFHVPVVREEPVLSTVQVPTGKLGKYSVDQFNSAEVVKPDESKPLDFKDDDNRPKSNPDPVPVGQPLPNKPSSG